MNGHPSQPQSQLPNPEGRVCAEETKSSPFYPRPLFLRSGQGHLVGPRAQRGQLFQALQKKLYIKVLKMKSPEFWMLRIHLIFQNTMHAKEDSLTHGPLECGSDIQKERGFLSMYPSHGASQLALVVKNLPANVGDAKGLGSIPGSGRSLGRGRGYSL